APRRRRRRVRERSPSRSTGTAPPPGATPRSGRVRRAPSEGRSREEPNLRRELAGERGDHGEVEEPGGGLDRRGPLPPERGLDHPGDERGGPDHAERDPWSEAGGGEQRAELAVAAVG